MGMVTDLLNDWSPAIYLSMNPAKYGHPGTADFKGSDAHAELVKSHRVKWMEESFPVRMGHIAAKVEKGGFLCGEHVTIADCYLVPALARFTSGDIDHVDPKVGYLYPAIPLLHFSLSKYQ